MGWPYAFLNLDEAERHQRRLALDRYALISQVSVLLLAALVPISRLAISALVKRSGRSEESYEAVPASPLRKARRNSLSGVWETRLRQLQWWLAEDAFGPSYGKSCEWVFGAGYLAWLLLMCIAGTGRDYLHITKRFGMIAISQLPVHYLLSVKSANPFAYIFSSSHEQINAYHRVLGRLISLLLVLHVTFYLNYFWQVQILYRRLTSAIVIYGIVAFSGLGLLYLTALAPLRKYSYRLFFITHVAVAISLPVLIWFHAPSVRLYVGEALLIFGLDLASRKLDTCTSMATLESVAGTNLVKIVMTLPSQKMHRFRAAPGSHIYLSVPASSRPRSTRGTPSHYAYELLFNPYSVASVDEEGSAITLVARTLGGPMSQALREGAMPKQSLIDDPDYVLPSVNYTQRGLNTRILLSVEGPYGSASIFSRLAHGAFDRVLLVAGGVGATFTVPLYRALRGDDMDHTETKVQLIWAVRTAAEVTWAMTEPATATPTSHETRAGDGVRAPLPSIMDDVNVQIFLTGSDGVQEDGFPGKVHYTDAAAKPSPSADAGVELTTVVPSTSRHRSSSVLSNQQEEVRGGGRRQSSRGRKTVPTTQGSGQNRRRPDLKKIVDEVFGHGAEERVAVLFCGPDAMGRELRSRVGQYVMKGRDVFWHNEAFGW